MPRTIKLRKGLNIKLLGEAERNIVHLPMADRYAVMPSDFMGVTPKMLVKPGDEVKAGEALFFDKDRPDLLFTSPVSGVVESINRGEKRVITEVVVVASQKQEHEQFDFKTLDESSKESITQALLKSGLWPFIIQRPYGIIANPNDMPKAIFISGFDSAPLAPDMNFALASQSDNVRKGIDILKRLTKGKVHLGLKYRDEGIVDMLTNAEQTIYNGPHPAGNVGVQIHHTDPINKGEVVWTVDIQSVMVIGRAFKTGVVDMTRVVAVTGSEVELPTYVYIIPGVQVESVIKNNIRQQKNGERVRIIDGNVLTGRRCEADGYLGYQVNQVTVIPEGDRYELFGWAMPRFNRLSVSRSYFSWMMPAKRYRLNTNLHGGKRPYIATGVFEQYLPMDIYPMHLLKAILAKDLDKMEELGIYEVVEEDFALCEFVDLSKNAIQQTIRDGINLMIKELS